MASDIQHKIDNHLNGQDSPVMSETLSVIDEHITDLGSTPRHSVISSAPLDQKGAAADSSSEYSSHVGSRLSYINGHETDEEEDDLPTEDEVRKWDPAAVALHLRSLGIDDKHCQIFEEQEIAGDVLLDMDQNFIFMKEFDFGVMGRRLKTWHKIKAFQEAVKSLGSQQEQPQPQPQPQQQALPPRHSSLSGAGAPPLLPRIPSLVGERQPQPVQRSRTISSSAQNYPRYAGQKNDLGSSLTAHSPHGPVESPQRSSAASIRHTNQSRRHSSIDTTGRSPVFSDVSSPTFNYSHRTRPSIDHSWSMLVGSQGQPQYSSRQWASAHASTDEIPALRYSMHGNVSGSDTALSAAGDRRDDFDRGYFSQTEADTRKGRRLLKKRTGSSSGRRSHSRQPSYMTADGRSEEGSGGGKRHLRISSAEETIRGAASHISAAAVSSKGRFSSLGSSRKGTAAADDKPTTTSNSGLLSRGPSLGRSSDKGESSPTSPHNNNGSTSDKFRRAMGLRAVSDTTATKKIDTAAASAAFAKDGGPMSARTGSTTPSAKSSERLSSEAGKTAEDASLMRAKASPTKGGVKSKKDTSAYVQGLEKKTPQEQMVGCDYYGWMRKRSSHLMAAWKPRLFILRGRRLSYYYSPNDTEERGLIDITAHRVLRADNDPLVTLHATLAASAGMSPSMSPNFSSPSSAATAGGPASSSSQGTAGVDPSSPSSLSHSISWHGANPGFVFKLVPPRTSRTVQFTKPTVHYFQVDDLSQGRLWMAALMKATIELDLSKPVESTNKQNTISLRHARMTNQRPPALLDPPEKATKREDESSEGLRIRGVGEKLGPENGGGGSGHTPNDSIEYGKLDPSTLPSEVVAALRSAG